MTYLGTSLTLPDTFSHTLRPIRRFCSHLNYNCLAATIHRPPFPSASPSNGLIFCPDSSTCEISNRVNSIALLFYILYLRVICGSLSLHARSDIAAHARPSRSWISFVISPCVPQRCTIIWVSWMRICVFDSLLRPAFCLLRLIGAHPRLLVRLLSMQGDKKVSNPMREIRVAKLILNCCVGQSGDR